MSEQWDIVRCPEIVSVSGRSAGSGYGSMEDTQDNSVAEPDNVFRSEFAKQLEQSLSPSPEPGPRPAVARPRPDQSQHDLARRTEELRRAKEEFMRVKQENLRLKYAVEKQRRDEERFQKLQFSVEHLTSRLHKMEEERAAYEELSEQLGCYIGLVSGQRGPGSCSTLPRIQVRCHDTSLDTSDADTGPHSFRSLPRHHRPGGHGAGPGAHTRHRSRQQERFRSRSRTIASNNVRTMKKEIAASVLDEEEPTRSLEISSAADLDKKKSSLGAFLTRVKIFLLKRKKYDVQTLV